METARPARPDDLADLVRLWEHAVTELAGQRGGRLLARALARPDLAGWLVGALADPDRLLVLGSIDTTAVGMASAVLERTGPGLLTVVEVIFVEPPARQVGVAEAMLEVVLRQSEAWGAGGVDAPALPGSRSSKSFFEVHGFQARLLTMHRPLGGEPA